MRHPDLRTLLPSKERDYLVGAFHKLLEESRVNWYGHPTFNKSDALGEFRDVPGADTSRVLSAFEHAKTLYDREHPLTWDNERQVALREGIPESQHLRCTENS